MSTPQESDRRATVELVGLAREGDRAAMEVLAARYLPRLKRVAHGRLPPFARDAMDTDDLVQEAWTHTLNNLSGFQPDHDFAFHAYLRQAVMNRVQNEIRNATRRLKRSEVPVAREPAPSPLDEAISQEAVERYEAALERIPVASRELLILRLELHCSYDEIATAVGKPTADAARMAVNRAVMALAEEMRRSERSKCASDRV